LVYRNLVPILVPEYPTPRVAKINRKIKSMFLEQTLEGLNPNFFFSLDYKNYWPNPHKIQLTPNQPKTNSKTL